MSSDWLKHIPTLSDDPTHPAQIALRTYAVALSLSLGPSIVPFITAILFPNARSSSRTNFAALKRVLRRELGHDGFAFAITLSVAGGAALRRHLCFALHDQDHKDPNSSGKPDNGQDLSSSSTLSDILNGLKRCVSRLTPVQQTFISYFLSSTVGIFLIQAGRERTFRLHARRMAAPSSSQTTTSLTSPTLDLTLLVLVRAVDSLVQTFILRRQVSHVGASNDKGSNHGQKTHAAVEPRLVYEKLEKEKVKRDNYMRQQWTSHVDAFVFWACSARIMWCFFYEPERLPRSYVKWIGTLANLDGRIIDTLKYIRNGTWSYIAGSPQHHRLLQASARDLGLPAAWGDPTVVPAYGGSIANEAWKKLGVFNRPSVGGIPCEILHAEVGSSLGLTSSCTANACLRTFKAFIEALAIYLPVHFLPVLLTRPKILMRPHRLLQTLGGAVRSATFLSSFIGLYWYTVCLTRSLILAKLFPFVSHDFWDGPFGCIMTGSLVCGSSIWIENGRRRGEMALYVLPRAVRACLPDAWIKTGNRGVKLAERMAFILSTSTLLTAAIHRPDSLRGLSRWALAFVTNGPNAGFWKRKRQDPSVPPTPSIPPTPFLLPQP